MILYIIISLLLLCNTNPYQHSIWLTSANSVSAGVYNTANNITSYFGLRQANEDLNRRNAQLQQQILDLQHQNQHLREQIIADTLTLPDSLAGYQFIVAHVISNSITHPHNYITINRGSDDGIREEMGVIDQNGVVGIVNVTSAHSARIISLLNPDIRLSCKIKNDQSFGSLVWDGNDPSHAILEELPRHTKFHKGDTIVTSGYSAIFPEGIPVGIITDDKTPQSQNFFTLHIRLLSDFTRLNNVQVIHNNNAPQLRKLQEADNTDDTQQ